MFHFGSGTLYGVQSSVNGVTTALPTPHLFGTLQDISLDIQFDVKELHGRKQFPDDIARGKGKITGKAKFANINGAILNDLFFGQTLVAGYSKVVIDEIGSITAGAYTNVGGAANLMDLGVRYAATGIELVRVASAPAVGQYTYTVATGVYAFNVSDNGVNNILVSYMMSVAGAPNTKTTVVNVLMGKQPKFIAEFEEEYAGGQMNVKLFACLAQKLQLASKLEDYLVPEFEFMAHADAAGNVIEINTTA